MRHFFPVLDVVMIGDDVRDDVNGGINYGLMVCNDYQGLLYTYNTYRYIWMESFMSSILNRTVLSSAYKT